MVTFYIGVVILFKPCKNPLASFYVCFVMKLGVILDVMISFRGEMIFDNWVGLKQVD